jgi:hypothetical protein
MHICASASGFEMVSAAFAILAAALWLWSSLTTTPDRLPQGPQKNLFSIFDVFTLASNGRAKEALGLRWLLLRLLVDFGGGVLRRICARGISTGGLVFPAAPIAHSIDAGSQC